MPAPSTQQSSSSSTSTTVSPQHHDDAVVDWSHVSFLPFPLQSYSTNEQLVAGGFDATMRGLVRDYREMFMPIATLRIGHDIVRICQPMALGRTDSGRPEDIAIPLLITHAGSTQLVMAYQSESQGCWRRYAGRTVMGYNKGNDQNWQNFDSRIQYALDTVMLARQPVTPMRGGRVLGLADFGISADMSPGTEIIDTNEERIYQSMSVGAAPLNLSAEGNMPGTLVRYWPSRNSAYGNYISAVVRSADNLHDYGIAVTRFGIFVQYVQDNRDTGINGAGAPARGVTLDVNSQWVMTPVLEYTAELKQQRMGPIHEGVGRDSRFRNTVAITGTSLGVRGGRSLVIGLHGSELSPFREINVVFAPVCRYLAAGDMNSAIIMLERFRTGRLE